MILQALVKHYEDLLEKGKISKPGWGESRVSYAVCLNDSGEITDIISLRTEQDRNGKLSLMPQNLTVPAPVKRSVGIISNFLCDNSSYIFGIDTKGKP